MDLQKVEQIVLGILAVMVIGMLGRIAISRYRRSLTRDSGSAGGLWTMADLRQMKDSGQLTDEEYEVLRQRMARKAMDSASGGQGKQNPPAGPNDKISR